MTPEEQRAAFAAAFHLQADSDWRIYNLLSGQRNVERCHVLHYLQMATEKIAKAYRIRDVAAAVDTLARRHTGFAEFVNQFMNAPAIRAEWSGRDAAREAQRQDLHRIAEVVERLAPAIGNLSTPENAEYPWERDERVYVPCEFSYPELDFLKTSRGRTFLNFVARAIRDYETITLR